MILQRRLTSAALAAAFLSLDAFAADTPMDFQELKKVAADSKNPGKNLRFTGGQCRALGGHVEELEMRRKTPCPKGEFYWGRAIGFMCSCACCGTCPLHVTARIDPETAFNRIPAAVSEKYRGLAVSSWKNPSIFVRRRWLDFGGPEWLSPEELPDAFARFPEKAWPYGKVVAFKNPGFTSDPELGEMNKLMEQSAEYLKRHGIEYVVLRAK